MFFLHIKSLFYSNSDSLFILQKLIFLHSSFHVLKNTCLIFVISSDQNVDSWQMLLLLWS